MSSYRVNSGFAQPAGQTLTRQRRPDEAAGLVEADLHAARFDPLQHLDRRQVDTAQLIDDEANMVDPLTPIEVAGLSQDSGRGPGQVALDPNQG